MTEYTDTLYNYIKKENNNIANAPTYNGMSAIKWIEIYYSVLDIYRLTGDMKAITILEWYRKNKTSNIQQKNNSYIKDDKKDKLEEVYNYIIKNKQLISRNNKYCFEDGTSMVSWVISNRQYIKDQGENGNKYAQYILIYINDYILKHTIKKTDKSKRSISHDQIFEQRLNEYYNYIMEHNKKPASTCTFSDNTNMISWKNNNHVEIDKYALNGNEQARIILFYNSPSKSKNRILLKEKYLEVIAYLRDNNTIPNPTSDICFKDGTNMGIWLMKKCKFILLNSYKEDIYASRLIQLIIEINPYYFNIPVYHIQLQEELNRMKNNYQYVKRK